MRDDSGRRGSLTARPGFLSRLLLRRLDPALREELFEPAWQDLRAWTAKRVARRLLLGPWTLLTVVQCLREQHRAALNARHERERSTMIEFRRDLVFAVRSLVRRPSFTLIAVVTLALGIGATSAVFALVNGMLLRPLPFGEPDRLVAVDGFNADGDETPISVPNFEDWSSMNRAFASMAGATRWNMVDNTGDRAERIRVVLASGAFFETLGVDAALGRVIGAEETGRDAAPIAVLSHGYWQRAYGGAADIIGQTLELASTSYQIVGVMPPWFGYPSASETEAYVPVGAFASFLPWNDRGAAFGTGVFARLADGSTVRSAQADMDRVTAAIDAQAGRTVLSTRIRPFTDVYAAGVRGPLLVLLGAVGFVMLIAVVNVANLVLTRAEGRRREVATCLALGASRAALLRQSLAEGLLLSGAGALVGIGLAYAGVRVLLTRLSEAIPPALAPAVRIDTRVLLFATVLALGTAATFALVPVMRLMGRARWSGVLREGGRAGTAGLRAVRVRSALVLAEIALAIVLVVGATLMIRTVQGLRTADSGFSHDAVITASVNVSDGSPARDAWLGFYEDVVGELTARPDVSAAGAALLVPLAARSWELRVLPEDVPWDSQRGEVVLYNIATPDFFAAMGIPILRGRGFTAADRDGAPLVTVIDETLAEHLWPGQDPIGRRLTFETARPSPDSARRPVYRTVVGVAPNVHHYELRNQARVQVWVPFRQSLDNWQQFYFIAARSASGDAPALASALRTIVRERDAQAVVSDVRTMEEYVDTEIATERALTTLLTTFGGIALVLAAVGVFGLMSIVVATRSREFGIRMAVGAPAGALLRGVLGGTLRLAVAGAVAGLLAAALLARVIASQLYGIAPFDVPTFLGVAALLVLVALLASLLPALRAARVDPITVLRQDA